MDFTVMIPRDDSRAEALATDTTVHSHWCVGCGTEWLCWAQPGDESDVAECPECDVPPDFLRAALARAPRR